MIESLKSECLKVLLNLGQNIAERTCYGRAWWLRPSWHYHSQERTAYLEQGPTNKMVKVSLEYCKKKFTDHVSKMPT